MTGSLYEDATRSGIYGGSEPLVETALKMLSDKAGISWGTGSHSFIAVPVYAIGAGAEEFDGYIDNTDIPKKLEKLMGLQ
jgi:alkaline phosphatase